MILSVHQLKILILLSVKLYVFFNDIRHYGQLFLYIFNQFKLGSGPVEIVVFTVTP